MPCRAGYGLCSGASSSSQSQPSSGQPATRRMSHPPFRQAQQLSLSRRFRRRLLLHRSCRKPRPRLRPHLRLRLRRRLRRRPRLLSDLAARSDPAPAPTPPPDAGQQAAAPPASPPPLETPSPPPHSASRRSALAAAGARTGGVGSPRRICAQEPRAAGRDLGLFRRGLRAAIPAARRRLGLSPAGGQVRPGRDRRVRRRRSFCLPPPAGSRARLKRKVGSR